MLTSTIMMQHYCYDVMITSSLFQLSLLRYDENGDLDQSTIIPLVDGGTEGSLISFHI